MDGDYLTQEGQVTADLQSYVAVQCPLGRIQLSPLISREGHSHILEAHRWLQHRLYYHTLWTRGRRGDGAV